MSKPISLTARISLLFVAAAAGVLLIAAGLLGRTVEDRFERRDLEELGGMMELVRTVLARTATPQDLAQIAPRIADYRFEHPSMAVVIARSDGGVLTAAGPGEVVRHLLARRGALPGGTVKWSDRGDAYRIAVNRFALGIPGSAPATVAIALDITSHEDFVAELQQLLWLGVAQAALAIALLGWLAVRGGLLPLHRFSTRVAAISAERLDKRVPEAGMPVELRELVHAVNGMLSRLEDSFRRLSEVSSDIAHELRTPLQNLLMQAQVTLSRERDAAEYRTTLQSHVEELERLSRMVSDMLFLARADNRQIALRREPVELHREVDRLLGFYEAFAADRGVRLEQSGAATVESDRLMIQRALSNLLSNAIRFTPAGRSITIAVSQNAGHAAVSVENPGERIPPERLSKIFDRLYRDPARRESDADHTGLGLAITKSIVEMHGGSVTAESDAGRTRFVLSLPRRPVTEQRRRRDRIQPSRPGPIRP